MQFTDLPDECQDCARLRCEQSKDGMDNFVCPKVQSFQKKKNPCKHMRSIYERKDFH